MNVNDAKTFFQKNAGKKAILCFAENGNPYAIVKEPTTCYSLYSMYGGKVDWDDKKGDFANLRDINVWLLMNG